MQEIDLSRPYHPYAITGLGLKYRAHPLGIAIALTQLPHLDAWMRGKAVNADRLREIVSAVPGVSPVDPMDPARQSSHYAFVCCVDAQMAGFTRDQLAAAIRAENFADIDIPASTAPLHTFAAFQRPVSPVTTYQNAGIRDPYPEAERIARESVKVSVPVEVGPGTRGDEFLTGFEAVWFKVTRRLPAVVAAELPQHGGRGV